jgi:tetratricopeptide (TPR) repeat protein
MSGSRANKTKGNTLTKQQNLVVKEPLILNTWIHLGVIVFFCFMAYAPSNSFDFTNWDEKRYIFETPLVQKFNWENIKLMFTNKVLSSYNPFVLMSLAWDYSIAGTKASWYHVHNSTLHILNSLLLYWVIYVLLKDKFTALFSALFFGLHPMHTEAVAWIASRKDVLYTFYYFISLGFFVCYLNNKRKIWFLISLVAFLCSLFAKSQAVTLPVVLMLFLFYREELNRKAILSLSPYFLLSLVFGLITLAGGNKGLTADEYGANFNFIQKIFLSTHALCLYLLKSILPFNQSAIYAFNSANNSSLEIISYLSFLIVPFLGYALYVFYKRDRLLFVGLSFFVIKTFLILHVLATNSSLIYERFTYVGYVGIGLILAHLIRKKFSISNSIFIAIFIGLVLIPVTRNRAAVWANSETLWTSVIENQPTVSVAYNNRGNVYYLQANWLKAKADFEMAIQLNPRYPNSYSNRGSVNIYLGKFEESLKDNEKAISINPGFPEAWLGRGVALYNLNRTEEAIECYDKAISLIPNFPNAYNNRGGAFLKLKRYQESINDFNKALSFSPSYDEARVNLSLVYVEMKEYGKAEETILPVSSDNRRNTTLSDIYLKQGLDAYQKGDAKKAIVYYDKAIAVYAENAEAWYNLGGTYLMQQNIVKAKECWNNVLRINPNHPEAGKWLKQIGG